MRDYQCKEDNDYYLPGTLRKLMLDTIRDYDRMKKLRDDILHSTPEFDGIPHTGNGSPTEHKAIRLATIGDHCAVVEAAFNEIPEPYRKPIKNNICYGTKYPYTAHRNTYYYWRRRLLYILAKKMYFL